MIGNILCEIVNFVSGANARWFCDPYAKAPRIYFANHSSHLDAFILWAALPPEMRHRTQVVAAKDYWEKTPLRRFISHKVYNPLLIDRNCHVYHDSPDHPIHQIVQVLDHDRSIVIFPEGTRSEDGTIQSFKSGLYHISKRRPSTELVPVYLENLNRMLPKGEFLFVPLIGSVTFGKPINFDPNENKEAFLERARRAIEDLEDV